VYASPNIIRVIKSRRIRWVRHVAGLGEMKNAHKMLVGRTERKRHRHRWEDNIRMDLGKIWWEVMDWIHMAWDRNQWWDTVNTVMNLRVP